MRNSETKLARGCSRSDDKVCSSVTKTSDNKELSSEHLSFLRKKHPNRVIIGHININFIRNKFDNLIAITKGNVEISTYTLTCTTRL